MDVEERTSENEPILFPRRKRKSKPLESAIVPPIGPKKLLRTALQPKNVHHAVIDALISLVKVHGTTYMAISKYISQFYEINPVTQQIIRETLNDAIHTGYITFNKGKYKFAFFLRNRPPCYRYNRLPKLKRRDKEESPQDFFRSHGYLYKIRKCLKCNKPLRLNTRFKTRCCLIRKHRSSFYLKNKSRICLQNRTTPYKRRHHEKD